VVANPGTPGHVFRWRITEAADPRGNGVRYAYPRDAGREAGPLGPAADRADLLRRLWRPG